MSTFVRFLGAAIVVLFVLVLNNQRYLGLSLPLLEDAFAGNAQPLILLGNYSLRCYPWAPDSKEEK